MRILFHSPLLVSLAAACWGFLLFCPVSRSSSLVGKMDRLPRPTHPRRQRTDDRGIVEKRKRPTHQFAVRRPSGRKRGLGYYYRTHSLSLSLSLPLSLPLSPCGFVLRLFSVCSSFVFGLFRFDFALLPFDFGLISLCSSAFMRFAALIRPSGRRRG